MNGFAAGFVLSTSNHLLLFSFQNYPNHLQHTPGQKLYCLANQEETGYHFSQNSYRVPYTVLSVLWLFSLARRFSLQAKTDTPFQSHGNKRTASLRTKLALKRSFQLLGIWLYFTYTTVCFYSVSYSVRISVQLRNHACVILEFVGKMNDFAIFVNAFISW